MPFDASAKIGIPSSEDALSAFDAIDGAHIRELPRVANPRRYARCAAAAVAVGRSAGWVMGR